MTSKRKLKPEDLSQQSFPLGQKWTNHVLQLLKWRMPSNKPLFFAEEIQNKYLLHNKLKHRTKQNLHSLKHNGELSTNLENQIQPNKSKKFTNQTDTELKKGHLQNGKRGQQLTQESSSGKPKSWLQEIEDLIRQNSSHILDSHITNFLSNLLKRRLPKAKIYANSPADRIVKKFGADAIAYQDSILFRAGKFAPKEEAGIALLGHELTHLDQTHISKNMPTRTTSHVSEAEEKTALHNERKILHHFSLPEGAADNKKEDLFSPLPNRMSHGTPSNIPKARPKTALSSRELSLPISSNNKTNPSLKLSDQQLSVIKDEIYRDLMERIRIEFERGA